MTHPLIEELLEPSRNLAEARDELATLYGLSDDRGLLEAAGDVEHWLFEAADRPPCPMPLEVRKRLIEAAIALFHLSKRYRATLEWIEETRH
jgi:hypothetical protein